MATVPIIPPTCPLCQTTIAPGELTRIVGQDMHNWPYDPPTNIVGHRACARGLQQLIIIRPQPNNAQLVRPS